MENNPEITRLQKALISILRKNGTLHSARIEEAFRGVPRHHFLPNEALETVYSDIAIAVKRGDDGHWTSSSSQPSMMAIMLEQLDLQPGQKVLEIGTGSGYNAALMAEIVGPNGAVVTIDIQPDLIDLARKNLDSAGFERVLTVAGDGTTGFPDSAPFDRIILTVASWVIVPAWREQLVEGGQLVLPLDFGKLQKSVAFERHGDELSSRSLFGCGFMSLQGAFATPPPLRTFLGADERLVLSSQETSAVCPQLLADWLASPGEDLPTGVQVKTFEFLSDLLLWLSLHTSAEWANFTALDEFALQQNLPVLIAWGGEWKRTESMLYLEPHGAAALIRPLGENLPWIDWNLPEEEQPPDLPFEIGVRPLGPDNHIAQRIVTLIRAWAAEGRPSTSNLHLRAVPAEKEVQLLEDEYLMERPWTKLVLWYV